MKLVVQLDCKHHVIHDGVPPEYVHCPVCDAEVHIFAIETREWKVRCIHPKCRFGKWCGASQETTHQVMNGHAKRHPTHLNYNVDFLQHPDKAEAVVRVYGPRFPRNILFTRVPSKVRRRYPVSDIPPF